MGSDETLLNGAEAELITRLQEAHLRIIHYRSRLYLEYCYLKHDIDRSRRKRCELEQEMKALKSANREEPTKLLVEHKSISNSIEKLEVLKRKKEVLWNSVSPTIECWTQQLHSTKAATRYKHKTHECKELLR